MITKSTVLILGAGASYPYGLPLGADLRKSICEMVDGDNMLFKSLKLHASIDSDEIKNFARQFKRSHVNSIDAFLSKRSEFTDIGKLAIAAALIEKEIPDKLANATGAEHWYSYMWNQISSVRLN